jgi:4-hydroxy-3-methylbut-2-en-1-yl diphosphate synthase IspG/GcpE
MKARVRLTVFAYQQLASQIDNPLHLGITEAGSLRSGTVKSSIGLGLLLSEGTWPQVLARYIFFVNLSPKSLH